MMKACQTFVRTALAAALVAALLVVAGATGPASADEFPRDVLARLAPAEQAAIIGYEVARNAFEAEDDAYWARIAEKRTVRRRKRDGGIAMTADDFIAAFPPKYAGPELAELLKTLWKSKARVTARPREVVAPLDAMLDHAKQLFGFEPHRVSEAAFKRRYAAEALAQGFGADAIVGMYAFETGGKGSYATQAGINSAGRGRPLTSALGYSQLVAANTIDELITNGDGYALRIEGLARRTARREQQLALLVKADIVRAMARYATRHAGKVWAEHVEFAKTPHGLAMHTLNLDADLGPWLQLRKLTALRTFAREKAGRALGAAELELLNLAGPGSGLDMIGPFGIDMPTANFFERKAYGRNPIVHGKTAAGLLAAITRKMREAGAAPGAAEFRAAFAAVQGRGAAVAETE